MLPTVRDEMHYAQIALEINAMRGGNAKLKDFLFEPVDQLEVIKEQFEFKPRAKKWRVE